MNINLRVVILAGFVLILLSLMVIRSCTRPPQKGELVYKTHCTSCHGTNGEGFRNLIPPLTDSNYLDSHADDFACIVGFGIEGEIMVNGTIFNQPMAGIEALNNVEIANVANYIYERWSTSKKKFTAKEIEIALANCE